MLDETRPVSSLKIIQLAQKVTLRTLAYEHQNIGHRFATSITFLMNINYEFYHKIQWNMIIDNSNSSCH